MTRFRSASFLFAFWASSVLSLPACTSGQTGGDVNFGGGESDSDFGCEDDEVTPVQADQELPQTALILQDLIDAVEGAHEAELNWAASERPWEGVTVAPDSGSTDLEVRVSVDESSGRFVTRRERKNDSGTEEDFAEPAIEPAGSAVCSSEMRVDASVLVRTEDGALDESFDVVFSTTDGLQARGSVPVDLQALAGDLLVEVQAGEDKRQASQTTLQMNFALGSLSGRISGLIETNDGQVASAGSIDYARFSSGGDCEEGVSLPEDAELGQQLRDALAAHTEFAFTWQGQEPVDFDLVPTLGTVCLVGGGGSGESSLMAELSLEASAADGSVGGTWPLSVDAQLEGQKLRSVRVFRNAYLADTFGYEGFLAATGIALESDAADAYSFTFGYVVELDEERHVTGELTVIELTQAECTPQEPADEAGGGQSSGGCAGTDFQEVDSGTFTER